MLKKPKINHKSTVPEEVIAETPPAITITDRFYVPLSLDNGVFDVSHGSSGAVARVNDGTVVRPRVFARTCSPREASSGCPQSSKPSKPSRTMQYPKLAQAMQYPGPAKAMQGWSAA